MFRLRNLRLRAAAAVGALLVGCSTSVDQPTNPRLTPTASHRDVTPGAPQLVIVEVMADPSKVADAAGEYIKLYNPGPVDVNLQNYKVLSAFGTTVYNGTTSVESHTITASIPLAVGACVVLGNNTAPASNGGITTEAYSYGTSITLGNNNTDWVEIKTPTGVLLDSVSYSASTINTSVTPNTRAITSPSYTAVTGTARSVVDPSVDNTVMGDANWVNATATFGAGDKGTPNDCQYTWRSGGGTTTGPLDHVAVSGPTSVAAGATITLTASPQDASSKPIATATVGWSSSNTAVATVDNSGVVTGVTASAQPVTITATATDNGITKTGTAQVTVTIPEIHWIDVSSSSSSFPPGFQTQLFATARVASGGTIVNANFTVEALDPAIATIALVQNTGIITGVAASATKPRFKITATPVGGGTPYEFTTTPVTIETPVTAPPTTYANNVELGLPSAATPLNANDLLIARPQYTLSYNESRGTPNWVSYELDARQIVSGQDRCNCFTADPLLPANKQILTSDYTNGGFDRGHMTRSADRTTANVDNASTFYLTNIVPQQADLNQGVWAQFENALGDSATKGGRAVYIITGPIYSRPLVFLKNEGKVAIPDSTWKVALIGPRNAGIPFTVGSIQSWDDLAGLTVLAVNMPNVAGVRSDPWQKYLTTVDRIEMSTGLDFLSLIPIAFQTAIEAGDRPPTASFTLSGTQAEGSVLALDASASTDPDLGRLDLGRTEALTYSWNFGDGTNATGKTPTKTYANNGTFTITLTVADAFGWQKTAARSVTISNVAPQVASFSGATILPGETYAASGAFTDPGSDIWSATVNYGDGSGSQALALSGKTFSLSHVYAAAGTFTVTVNVSDGDATSSRSATVVVESPAQGIAHLDDGVQQLSPSLNAGQINSLRSKLRNAAAQLEKGGGAGAAASILTAFANEIQASIAAGRVDAPSGNPIIAYARRVIASLGG